MNSIPPDEDIVAPSFNTEYDVPFSILLLRPVFRSFLGSYLSASLSFIGLGAPSLWLSSWSGNPDAIRSALNNGSVATVNVRRSGGWSPLHRACLHDFTGEGIRVLLEKGASVTIKDRYARAPLHIAAGAGNIEAVRMLLEQGSAFAEVSDGVGRTPAHWAALAGSVDILRLLHDVGRSELSLRDSERRSALHCAAHRGSAACCAYLVLSGCSLDDADVWDQTPLVVARRHHLRRGPEAELMFDILEGKITDKEKLLEIATGPQKTVIEQEIDLHRMA